MTREEFIKRLEEVGFRCDFNRLDGVPITYFYEKGEKRCCIFFIKNKDIFLHKDNAYFYNELEQFLIEHKIVRKPFDAHEYLLSRGFEFLNKQWYSNGTFFNIDFNNGNICIGGSNNDFFCVLEGLTQLSCDGAIELVKFLDKLKEEKSCQ